MGLPGKNIGQHRDNSLSSQGYHRYDLIVIAGIEIYLHPFLDITGSILYADNVFDIAAQTDYSLW